MKSNMKQTLIAPALLLLALALGSTGCSQDDDAPASATQLARGGEPISISVAPKPGFADNGNPGTRNTVADDGSFEWVPWVMGSTTYDQIYLLITFNDAAATQIERRGTCNEGLSYVGSFLSGWQLESSWTGSTDIDNELSWPMGASSATVQAFYTDCARAVSGNFGSGRIIDFRYYSPCTGDHMLFEQTITLGSALSIDFSHVTTRLVFRGLAPSTAYSLNVNGTSMTYSSRFTVSTFSLDGGGEQTFTSDADGKLVICADLDDKINAATGKLSIELMMGAVSVGTTELTAKGTAGAYRMNGYQYTVNVAGGSGSIDPDSHPDLLPPAPIIPGNKVYVVNGYYVTAPNGNENKQYQWASSTVATVMDSDPCAGHGNWRMPTMEDFEKMAGWTESHRWSQDAIDTSTNILSDKDAWNAAFPGGNYWSSVAHTSDSNVWLMYSDGNGTAYYKWYSKPNSFYVRCVQVQ